MRSLIFLATLLMTFCLSAHASESSAPEIQAFADAEQQLTIDDIREMPDEKWLNIGNEAPSFGYTSDAYWLKFSIPGDRYERVIHIGYPLLDYIDVYFVNAYGEMESFHTGDNQPFADRPLKHEEFVIPVPFKEPSMVFLRVESGSSMRIPVAVWNEQDFYIDRNTQSLAMGIYYGVLICMIVYNLFTFAVTREPGFLSYSSYVTFTGLLVASLSGAGYRYLWADSAWLQERAVILFGSFAIIFASLFIYQLLSVRENSPRFAKGLRIFAGIMAAIGLLSLILPYEALIRFFLASVITFSLYIITMAIVLTYNRVRYAKLFLVAWVSLLFAVMVNSLAYLGILDGQYIQRYAIMVGSGIEVLILSLILTLRYSRERTERLEAQESSLQSAQLAENMQRQLNEELEQLVEERTNKLESVMKQLKKANQKLERKNNEDGLTGLYNRRYFDEQLDKEFRRAKRTHRPMALVMIDIDHFKDLNDDHGHLVGDEILKELSKRMKKSLRRATDSIYRYGGEEFVAILAGTGEEQAIQFAQSLANEVFNKPFITANGPLRITISCGVASAEGDQLADAKALLFAADEALLKAKKSGRNKTVIAEQSLIDEYTQARRSN